MQQLRRSTDRGLGDHGWLKSRHTFSFASYHDPKNMGFRSLRVINEDRIAGGTGFDAHPHRDMEIISYVMTGALQHEDSMGNQTVIKPGEVQRMSAGTGVVHSEYNDLKEQETHFFQIWIMPKLKGIEPGYGQKSFEEDLRTKKLVLVVSQDAREGSIGINQDADLYLSRLAAEETLDFPVRKGRGIWIQVLRGEVTVNGSKLLAGDAIALTEEEALKVSSSAASEIMIFDLA
ncbi:MAG: pirin family protein [Bdellovibrionaceae bacterium]|nr:pirin family protein [Pseudobdellovibrionaceae bacterium]